MISDTSQPYQASEDQNDLPIGLTPRFIVWLAILLGGALRIAIVLKADFPLTDGGLFYNITRQLVTNGFRPPNFILYNGVQIPFAYPPFGFYLTGMLNILGMPIIQAQRWIPLFFCILTIPAFALLSKAVLKRSDYAALATLSFALLPTSIDRLLMGGGITRAPGFFFGLLALSSIYRALENGARLDIFFAVIFSAVTLLTHPVYVVFILFSSVIFFLFASEKNRNIRVAFLIGFGVLVLTSIWWIHLLTVHGLTPVFYALTSRNALPLIVRLSQLFFFDLSEEYFLEVIGVFSLLGLLFTLFKRDYFFIVWLAAIFIFERTTPVSLAVVPLAMLAGTAAGELLSVAWTQWKFNHQSRLVMIIFSLLVYYSAISTYLHHDAPLITPELRFAFSWATNNTPPDTRFVVLSGYPWWDDAASEWFPALTSRVSVTTVQGYEWMPPQNFYNQARVFDEARACLSSIEPGCLENWAVRNRIIYDFIFIPNIKPARHQPVTIETALIQGLRQSPNFDLIYESDGGVIFKKR